MRWLPFDSRRAGIVYRLGASVDDAVASRLPYLAPADDEVRAVGLRLGRERTPPARHPPPPHVSLEAPGPSLLRLYEEGDAHGMDVQEVRDAVAQASVRVPLGSVGPHI